MQFIDEVMRRLPFRVHVVQTDNGAEFQSQFHCHLETRDIRHVYIRPRTPRLNGKVERSHRIDDQEFYQLLDQDGTRLFDHERSAPIRPRSRLARMIALKADIRPASSRRIIDPTSAGQALIDSPSHASLCPSPRRSLLRRCGFTVSDCR